MTRTPRRNVATPTALLAAALVVLQALFAGLSTGAHASPVLRDAFGGTLCLGAAGFGQDDGAPGNHDSTHCCAFGCHLTTAAPLLAPAPLLLRSMRIAVVSWRIPAAQHRFFVERSSIRLRGPPGRI